MSIDAHRAAAPAAIPFALLTVSDTRTLDTDKSGLTAAELLTQGGMVVTARRIVRDEPDAIRAAVLELLATPARALYLTGGTGIAPRDRTPDTVAPLLERELPGFGEIFRHLSFLEIGTAAILSRALCGLRQGKVVFVTPGSTGAVRLAVTRLVLPEVGHILAEAGKTT